MTKENAVANFLDSQDFYELMQAYRHEPLDAAKQFEAVRLALYAAIAQPVQPIMTDAAFKAMCEQHHAESMADWEQPVQPTDSTPKLNVGESSFESWYQAHEKACTGDKQLPRDAYAAGMGDPLVTYAQPVQPADTTIDSILEGIDLWSGDTSMGWWETSDEVAFGASKLAEIKSFFAASQAPPVQPALPDQGMDCAHYRPMIDPKTGAKYWEQVVTHFSAVEPTVQPAERNFCETCGQRLGDADHIHTCSPPAI